MHILIAPNAFKNSLPAKEAALAIRAGLETSGLECSTSCFPIGDGGDGTGALLLEKIGGHYIYTQASDPLGDKIQTAIGISDDGNCAVIEMSGISGMRLLGSRRPEPLCSSSYGCGELIRLALDQGVKRIILAIGGSATVDGGSGILKALGVRFTDQKNMEFDPIPKNLQRLHAIDLTHLDKRIPETEIIILCDVNNFLLGEKGAAAVFGPQKGAAPDEVRFMEKALKVFRDISLHQTGTDMNKLKHGGAAGGVAAGLHVYLNARLVQGIEYFLDATGFNEALEKADLLITGEGSIDLQTLEGKAPYGVAVRAKKKNIPVIGLAGQVPLHSTGDLDNYFDILMGIGRQPEDLKTAMLHTKENLRFTGTKIGQLLDLGKKLIAEKT